MYLLYIFIKIQSRKELPENTKRSTTITFSGIANKRYEDRGDDYITEGGKQDVEFQMFNMVTISEATNSFSSSNKLGQGGFGPVYKVANSFYVVHKQAIPTF